ncbi:MAG: ABC transporter substrate-binding protein [Nitrospinae bacterium]|nr:ABC transporter substrate-binding protein [Nitrospinota bacterium]
MVHRKVSRRTLLQGMLATAATLPFCRPDPVPAQGRAETLVAVGEFGPNTLDIHGVGANRPSYAVAWNCYDRLLTYGKKTLSEGTVSYAKETFAPELAERWEMAPDGTSITFQLRKDARFHDGRPVTAKDVKWSFDRAVSVGGFPTFQMKAGSLERPDQFVAINEHTFRIHLLRKDRLTLPDLAVPVAIVINSELARQHASSDDPWALEYLKANTAGGGAFKAESWRPGTEITLTRYDGWQSGPLPGMRRVIWRDVPSAGSRLALMERGDADISYGVPPKDAKEIALGSRGRGKLKIVGVPIPNAMWYLGMNVKNPPFNQLKVRQAVAYALPYDQLMKAAMYERAIGLYGASTDQPATSAWPQPFPYRTNVERARQLMAEAGVSGGFETTLSFDLGEGTVSEPMAVLIQEGLAQLHIKTTINKTPGSQWRSEMAKKTMPLLINRFGGWLDYPEYFFFWTYHGQNAVFNTMSYQNPALDKLIDAARFAEDPEVYGRVMRDAIRIVMVEVPRIPLCQPLLDVTMQANVSGYQFWFHLQPDFRQLAKA